MTIASGVDKKVVVALQPAKGTAAKANSPTATYLRRTTSSLDLRKETYQSNEIRPDQQIADFRHGVRSVDGSISCDLAPGSLAHLIPNILRKSWADGIATTKSDVTAALVSGGSGTFTTAAGNWLTDGYKVGDVVRWGGWAVATSLNSINMMITALTTTVMTCYILNYATTEEAFAPEAAGASVTCTVTGQKCWVPDSGQTKKYLTFEHHYSDLDLSELFTDCRVSQLVLRLPPTGMATTESSIVGLNMTPKSGSTSPYFTSPAAASTGGSVAAVNGGLFVEGTQIALLTGLDITIGGDVTAADPVVGANTRPDLFPGRVSVTGNMTVYFEDATFRDYFLNETEVSLCCAFTESNDDAADFVAVSIPRLKVGGSSKDDGEKGLIQTVPFQALLYTTGGTGVKHHKTTISIQDSMADDFVATTTTTTTSSTTTTTA